MAPVVQVKSECQHIGGILWKQIKGFCDPAFCSTVLKQMAVEHPLIG